MQLAIDAGNSGVKFGLFLPLNSIAIVEANLPRFWPFASTRTQSLLTVFLFAEMVLKLIVSKFKKFLTLKKSTQIYN